MTVLPLGDSDEAALEGPLGAYVYGVVRLGDRAEDEGFLQPPMPGAGPATIVEAGEYGVIVSAMAIGDVDPTRRNLLAHTRILEEAMRAGPVLPVRFGTIADDPDQLSPILDAHGEDFTRLFARIEGKVELGVKAFWDMERLFAEVGADDPKIRQLKEQLQGSSEAKTYYQRIDLGRRIEDAIDAKREAEASDLLRLLTPLATEVEITQPTEDRMVLNAAFLVEAGREAAFDAVVADIRAREDGRMTLRYIGPVPAYSFVSLSIDWSPGTAQNQAASA